MAREQQIQFDSGYLAKPRQQLEQDIVNVIKQAIPGVRFHHDGFMGLDISEGVRGLDDKRHTATLHLHGEAPRSGEVYKFQHTSGDTYQYVGVVKETKYEGLEKNQMGHLVKLESVREIQKEQKA